MLRRALKARPGLHLKRAIQLDLGGPDAEAHTRQLIFKNVASGYIDTLSNEARARAGQMAIEYRRYDDAQRHLN